jgi:hypothetical protein
MASSTSISLEACCSDRQIVKLLWRARLRQARHRRERRFHSRLVPGYKSKAIPWDFDEYFPPRADWPTPGAKRRARCAEDGIDAQLELMTTWTIRRFGEPNTKAPLWLKRLRRLSSRIRKRILGWRSNDSFVRPDVRPVLKRKEDGVELYRALTQFELEDALIGSLVARYFRKQLEPYFDSASLAFRAPMSGPPPTHHDAVERIIEFQTHTHSGKSGSPLWVAEVDIRGFFDSVVHAVVRNSLREIAKTSNVDLDGRAHLVLDSYLACYSFNEYGRAAAFELAVQESQSDSIAVPWPEEELKELGVDVHGEPVGVPQGGALSCFIANLVLHFADAAVRTAGVRSSEYLYLRYCDDIVIVTRDKDSCHILLDAYLRALRDLKLPSHPTTAFDGRSYLSGDAPFFWKSKSKEPFAWADPRVMEGAVPWCSFVGYQLRWDGILRVRPASLKKAVAKHRDIRRTVAERVVGARARKPPAKTLPDRQILFRTRQKLRSTAVGTTLLHLGATPSAICWAGGFRLLRKHGNPILRRQLRMLDRHKCRQLRRLRRALKKHPNSLPPLKALTDERIAKYDGRPYSYHAIADPKDGDTTGNKS